MSEEGCCPHYETERTRPRCDPPCEMPWCIVMRWRTEIDATRKARHEAHALLVQAMRILELGQVDEGPEKRGDGRIRGRAKSGGDQARGLDQDGERAAVSESGGDQTSVSGEECGKGPLPIVPKPRRRRIAGVRGAPAKEQRSNEETDP